MGFPVAHRFAELNEDWEIVEQTSDVIRLKHISGGNGGTDILEFGRQAVFSSGGSTSGSAAIVLPSGSCKISLFQDKDKNKTSNYTGYQFVFNANGIVSASTPTSSVAGTWKGRLDSGKSKILLSFPIATKLQELNEDWELVSQSATSIQLKNVSGGNGGTSTLTFTK
ncbi:MAG: hypothetical protein IPN29_21715 [Saprospiraceae bacterium]|nr:hypothetical protein [Saprospiraceae bacterium]